VLKAAAHVPVTVQQSLSRFIASPRTFNLVVSNIPGPSVPMYMLGCPLEATYPVVPLADRHAVSVGMTTIHEQACFGVYADREALPDVDMLAHDIDDAITELLSATEGLARSRSRRVALAERDEGALDASSDVRLAATAEGAQP
jgi:diacylglycerol O-acyltransferase / wax synthase